MAIDFNKTFGAAAQQETKGQTNNGSSSQNRPVANFWLNIGYVAEGAGDDGEDRFVSLPVGIPVDTMEPVSVNSRSDSYREFQSARNDLYEQVMAVAKNLKPGEDKILNLQIQLRRIGEERGPVAAEQNRYARNLEL